MNNSMIKTVGLSLALAGTTLILGTGCMATSGQAAHREVNQREDYLLLEEKLRRVQGDMETMSMQLEQLRGDIQRIQSDSAHATDARTASLRTGLGSVEDRISRLESQRETDRREIIDSLSRKVAELVNAASPPPSNRRSSAAASGYGFEHTVETGETLSRIAQAYGSTVSAIMKANNIQDPDSIRVDDRLIIPE